MTYLMRRLWWATLPYEGWISYGDIEEAIPPPWYAHPLAWIHRRVDYWMTERDIDRFGPVHTFYAHRPLVGDRLPKPWL